MKNAIFSLLACVFCFVMVPQVSAIADDAPDVILDAQHLDVSIEMVAPVAIDCEMSFEHSDYVVQQIDMPFITFAHQSQAASYDDWPLAKFANPIPAGYYVQSTKRLVKDNKAPPLS